MEANETEIFIYNDDFHSSLYHATFSIFFSQYWSEKRSNVDIGKELIIYDK